MKSDYLQEAAEIMSRCLSGHERLSLKQDMAPESLAIYLAVGCKTLGEPSTRRWVTGKREDLLNPDSRELEARLEIRHRGQTNDRMVLFMEGIFDLSRKRSTVLEAGMSAKALDYIMQDTNRILAHLLNPSPAPNPAIEPRFDDLAQKVCQEAQQHLDRFERSRTLERAAKVVFGAAARVTAAKLSGGVSEVLNALGEISIDKGLE